MRILYSKNQPFSSYKPKCKQVIDVIWRHLASNVNSSYTYLQCIVILNNHNGFVLGLLILKNELDDDSDVMIMIEKIRKFSVFYLNFPTFKNVPNVSCSSTNYLWFVLEYINKIIDWDCCLFCNEPKYEELRRSVKKHYLKRKQTKKRRKLKKLTRKFHHSSINLLNKICFRWKYYLVMIMKRQYSKYSTRAMQSSITIVSQTINRNWRDLWRKEREIMVRRK